LRKAERRTVTSTRRSETAAAEARETSSPRIDEAAGTSTETVNETQEKSATTTSAPPSQDSSSTRTNDEPTGTTTEARPQSAAAATAPISSETTEPAAAPSAIGSIDEFSTERLRDYVAAFVLAGLDKNVGAETEFFADRVEYYDQGSMNHDQIREDLKRYDERWPERHFWVAGKINIEPQTENRVRVTFPLGFKLRNGNRQSSGKVDKTLVLERAGDDLQIVAVGEVSESKK
jgi:hypothetical protein